MKTKTIYWIIGIIVVLLALNQGRKFGFEDDFIQYTNLAVEDNIFNLDNQFINPCDSAHAQPQFNCANWWWNVNGYTFTDTFGDISCSETVTASGTSSYSFNERICTGKDWTTRTQSRSWSCSSSQCCQIGSSDIQLDTTNKKITMKAWTESDASLKLNKNIYGYDLKTTVKISIKGSTSCGGSSPVYLDIIINGQKAHTISGSVSKDTPWTYWSYAIEIVSSKLNPHNINIYVNNQLVKEITLTSNELYLGYYMNVDGFPGDHLLELSDIKYRIPFSCVMQEGDLLAIETFAGGQDIDINDLRFPVKSFCLAHPVIITSPDGSTTTAEPYQILITGQPVTIPSDQTWSFFYVFDNSGQIVRTCPSGEAYDPANDYCRDVHGLVQVCSEGVFDPEYGSCVIYPEVKEICDIGRWDIEKQACVWNPPVMEICETGTWSAELNACVWHPDVKAVCTQGEFNPDTSLCEYTPLVQGTCTQGTYDAIHKICIFAPDVTQICSKGQWDAQKKLCIWNPPVIIDQPVTPSNYTQESITEPTSPIVWILIGGIIFMAFIALRQKGYLRFKRKR